MNSCVLMAQVVEAPKLRYTQDNQTPVADMFVEFAGTREGEPPGRLRVVGWNNLATEIQEQYQVGDRLIIQGRLQMDTVERTDGIKEKRAQLVASRIYRSADGPQPGPAPVAAAPAAPPPSNVVPLPTASSEPPAYDIPDYDDYEEAPPPKAAKPPKNPKAREKAAAKPATPPPPPVSDADLDDIPF